MKYKSKKALLQKLLLGTERNKRLWPGVLILFLGITLLSFAVIIWASFNELLEGKDALGNTFLTINKSIPEEKIADQKLNVFTPREIQTVLAHPQVTDAGIYNTAAFPVVVTFKGDTVSYSTDIFIEAVPDRFIDNLPLGWEWHPGNKEVPVIISKDFLNLYNFGFAPNEGVPQLTEGTIITLSFELTIGGKGFQETYTTRVAGFSNRISSIIVPAEFVEHGNQFFTSEIVTPPTRLILKVKDPSEESFVRFLNERNYTADIDMQAESKIRLILKHASVGITVLVGLAFCFGVLLLVVFIRLMLSKTNHAAQLLYLIGYHPVFLHRYLVLRYIAIIILIAGLSFLLSVTIQIRLAKYLLEQDLVIQKFPAQEVWITILVIVAMLILTVNGAIRRSLKD